MYIEDIEENLRAGGGKGPFMLTLEYPQGTVLTPPRAPIIMLQGMIKCVACLLGHVIGSLLKHTYFPLSSTHPIPMTHTGAPARRW